MFYFKVSQRSTVRQIILYWPSACLTHHAQRPVQRPIGLIRPPGTLVPGGLMFYPWCSFFFRHEISELPRPIAVTLCHMIASWVNFIMQVQKFGGPSPKEIGAKNMQKHAKFGAISDNFRVRSQISPERVKTSKIGKTSDHERFLPRSTKKSDELWSTNFKGQHVKFGLKFRVCAPITLRLVGVTSRNFSTRRAARQGCSRGHYFWGRPAR